VRSRILLGVIFGAVGGLLGHLAQEMSVRHDPILAMPLPDVLKVGAYVGAFIGVGVGAVEGVAVSSSRLLLRGMVLGGIIGVLGGLAGIYFGGIVYGWALFGQNPLTMDRTSILAFTHHVVARALGWTFLGAFPGLAAGAATLSRRRALHGLAGGLLGGFLGGFVFDLVAELITQPTAAVAAAAQDVRIIETGGPSRAIGFTLIGLLTGLFIGLVEELLKQAWVRVLAGRNEGRDYILSKPLTILGRDERADIPLFGDRTLAPQHAAIKMEGGRHYLLDGGARPASMVNGQPVQGQQLLRDGDMIQLGQVRILFREKATASRVARPAPDAARSPQVPGAVQMPAHLCPFCGAQKDARGACLCTVPGAAPDAGFAAAPAWPQAPGPQDSGFGAPAYPGPQSAPAATAAFPAAAGAAGSRLTGLEGPYAGQVFPLAGPVVTIGRDPSRDIALGQDSTVSRSHARVAWENGQHVLYDEGSSNGTFVNGVRVSIQALVPGDVIQFGASKFRYE